MVNYCQTKIVKIQPKHNIIYLRPSDSLSHSVGNEWYVSDHGLVLCEVMSLTCGDPDQSKHKNDLDNNKQPFLVILWAPDLTSSPTVVAMNDMRLTMAMPRYYYCQYLVVGQWDWCPCKYWDSDGDEHLHTNRKWGDPIYDSTLPDTHRCQVEERRGLSKEDTCTSR